MDKKAALIILDGWGLGNKPDSDAIHNAETPCFDQLIKNKPNARLKTYGSCVGLPQGQVGNSEVGHLNIGAGRPVFQDLLKINRAIESGSFDENPVILELADYCLKNKKKLHLLCLLSDGGVHSHINHLVHAAKLFDAKGIECRIHAFTDGRDTDPKAGKRYLNELISQISGTSIKVASVCGRYYAMDRDNRWERIRKVYDLLVKGEGIGTQNFDKEITAQYDKSQTDEFILPMFNKSLDLEDRTIQAHDAVFFLNFRTDRPRQLTQVLTQSNFPDFGMEKLPLYFTSMTMYDVDYKNVHVVYPKENLKGTLGEYLEGLGKTQLRVAETEKYPHVTFFFNGGREEPYEGEERLMVPSPKVATYDMKPEMSADEVTNRTITYLEKNKPDFLCLNFANTDMVGHTGDFEAAKKACQAVDTCLSRLTKCLRDLDYSILIIADHGNADFMINDNGSPNTAHTKNPVPVILDEATQHIKTISDGDLTDIAPTILKMMGLESAPLMTGKALF